jgi:Putative transposase
VVPGGGLSLDGTRWIACRPGFFLPVRVLSRLFRRLFLTQLEAAFDTGRLRFFGALIALHDRRAFLTHLGPARQAEWVVYAKRPFAGPQQVLDYVGRYSHRVAISNDRIHDIDHDQVRFTYKDYRTDSGQAVKTMTLAATEFMRRFLLHVLPLGFHRIRYYGFLGPRHRKEKLARCRQLLATPVSETTASASVADYRHRHAALTCVSLHACPMCRRGRMLIIDHLPRACVGLSIVDSS